MKKIKLLSLALILSASTAANAQNFLMADNTNDPQYIGDDSDVATDLTENVLAPAVAAKAPVAHTTAVNNPTSNEFMGDIPQALVEKDIRTDRFYLKDSEAPITEKVISALDKKNISLANLKFKRDSGTRKFNLEQVKGVVIKTKFSVESVELHEDESNFTVTLKPQNASYKIVVTGDYNENQKVPVLSRNIGKGEKITQDDIELKAFDKADILSSSITDVNSLIGKTATHGLGKGKMISNEDIRSPVTVAKNSTLSAIYRTDSIEIKTLAVALEDGSDGDIIRMKNFDSGKVFKAVIQADGTALIGTNKTDITASLPDNTSENNYN